MTAKASRAGSLYGGSGRRKYLTQDERTRFLDAARRCERRDVMTLCLTLAYTGARISEALMLTTDSIEAAAGFVAVRSLKKRSRTIVIREIPVPEALIECLALVHGLNAVGKEARLWPLSRCRAWRLIKGVMDEAGIPHGLHATPKGLRHGFGLPCDPIWRAAQLGAALARPCPHGDNGDLPSGDGRRGTPDRGADVVI